MIKRLLLLLTIFLPLALQAQFVTLTGKIQASNGINAADYTINFTPNQWFYIAGTGVVVNTTTSCGTSSDGTVVGTPNPLYGTIVTAQFTGTLPPANYFVEYTFVDALGHETLPSPETPAQLTSTGGLVIASPASGLPANATGLRIYVGATSGGEQLQGTASGTAPFTLATPLVSGAAPPSTNNTVCQQIANDAGWPTGTGYNVSLVDPQGNTLPGYPMLWQLLGPGTTINLSNGLPYYHGVVTFPSPILASPLNHAAQSISGPLNLQGYNLTGVNSLTACVVNGTVYAACLPGADIGAKINAALNLCASQCTIYVAAGGYNFATQIRLPLNVFGLYKLELDAGASIHYTGSSDAIITPIGVNGPGSSQLIIEGGQLTGTSAATSGIHTLPTNRITIRNMLITGFTNGDGIRVEGTNASSIYDNLISGNLNGIHLIPTICNNTFPYTCSGTMTPGVSYTPNNMRVHDNNIVSSVQWAIKDERNGVTAGLTGSLNNFFYGNDLENNGTGGPTFGAFYVEHSRGEIIGPGNYFEGSPRELVLGELGAGAPLNTSGPVVFGNHFTSSPPISPATKSYDIELQNTTDALIEGNDEIGTANIGSATNCFLNAATGGETRTLLSRNAIFQNTTDASGNQICVNGTGVNALVGAGSATLISQQYQAYMADQFFQINTAVTSEAVGIQNMTGTGSCQLQRSVGDSAAINAGAASILANTSKITAASMGGITLVHPSGTAMTYDILCQNNPTGGFGYP